MTSDLQTVCHSTQGTERRKNNIGHWKQTQAFVKVQPLMGEETKYPSEKPAYYSVVCKITF